MYERMFASRSSRISLVNDRINNHHKVLAILVFVLDGVPDFNTVFLVDALGFFYSTLPPEGELSLDELHLIVRDIWLSRYDKDLEQERAKRRKGRPKSAKEVQIEELKTREAEEYKTGFGSSLCEPKQVVTHLFLVIIPEVPDLTHEINVELFRGWDQKEAGYLQMLRYIRISSADPETVIISRPGQHPRLISVAKAATTTGTILSGDAETMDITG